MGKMSKEEREKNIESLRYSYETRKNGDWKFKLQVPISYNELVAALEEIDELREEVKQLRDEIDNINTILGDFFVDVNVEITDETEPKHLIRIFNKIKKDLDQARATK